MLNTLRHSLALLLFGAIAGVGCSGSGSGPSTAGVTSQAISIDRSSDGMTWSNGIPVVLSNLEGTYGQGCKMHPGEAWQLPLNRPGGSLEVALNDSFAGCPLTLTAINFIAFYDARISLRYTFDPAIVLGLAFAPQPSTVDGPAGSEKLAFYGNAKLSGLRMPAYTSNFSIVLIYSNVAVGASENAPPAVYSEVGASASGSAVPPPKYDLGFDSLVVVVDASNVVQNSSSGTVDFTASGQTAENWRIFDQTQAVSFADIDNLYLTGKPISSGATWVPTSCTTNCGGLFSLDWTKFGLAGQTLPVGRTIVLKHIDGGGIYSYELFQVRFPPPVSSGLPHGCSVSPGSHAGGAFAWLVAGLFLAGAAVRRRMTR